MMTLKACLCLARQWLTVDAAGAGGQNSFPSINSGGKPRLKMY